MKAGTTQVIVVHLDLLKPVDNVIFTLKTASSDVVEKKLTNDNDGTFILELTQEDTELLEGNVAIEAQINYQDKSVQKTNIMFKRIDNSLATTFIQGNKPDTSGNIDIILEEIKGDVALVIGPDSSRELIDAIVNIFNEVKDIAEDVQSRADSGEFDGKDGKDGKDYVLTEEDKEEIAGMVEGGGTTGEIILLDTVTGEKYTLSVVNGKLTMEGVK